MHLLYFLGFRNCIVRTQAFGQGCSPAFGRREAAWHHFYFLSLFED
jgi:hypothetical protein